MVRWRAQPSRLDRQAWSAHCRLNRPGTANAFTRFMMAAPTRVDESPAHASMQVLESAVALARAELKLLQSHVLSHVYRLGGRAAVAVGLSWLAMCLTQLALLMLAVSPIVAASFGLPTLIASIAPAILLAAIAWFACIRSWRGLFEPKREPPRSATPDALGLGPSDLHRR